jgi:hypothetical protein
LPEIEVLNVCMLPFLDSPGDQRAFIIDISNRLLLGEFYYKVCYPISHRLITSQQSSVDEYNRIVCKQFDQHRIVKRLDVVDRMSRYCGFPSSNFLQAMIIKLYRQMTEIKIHAEKKCRKILRPNSNYSSTVQMWYDRIHAYLQLIRMKEGKNQECWQHNMLCHTHQHTGPRQTHGGAERWSQIMPNLKIRTLKASQRSQEDTPERLSH